MIEKHKSVREVSITIDVEDGSVYDVINQIESKTDFQFSFNNEDLTKLDKFDLSMTDVTVADVLIKLSEEVKLKFKQHNENISISPLPKSRKAIVPTVEILVDINVSGTITDEMGEPMPGATVLVKGTSNGTITDIDGQYTLVAPDDGTLVISFVGYASQEVAINGQSTINVSLDLDASQLDEIVVVGYGEQKKVTVTGAVAALEGKKLVKSPAVEITNSLAGRLPGLVVIQESGEPGADGATIKIRGTNTLGNSSPLIVIDGVPDREGGLGRLSPQDIESISVLKDASAAIYGARAANGAILVTTKRGVSGKPTLSFDFNQGWSQPTQVPRMSNAGQYADIMNELPIYKSIPVDEWDAAWSSIQSTGTYTSPTAGVSALSANYSPDAVAKHKDGSDPWGHPDTDWFGDAFKTWAPQSRYNLQLAGGSDNIRYMGSLGFINQDGIYKNTATYYKQYNLRLNIDADINDYIKTRMGVMTRREDRNYPTQSAGSIFRMLMRGRPSEPEVWPNGLPGPDIENGQNPYVITTNATGYHSIPKDFLQANGSVDIDNPWIDGLRLTLSAAVDQSMERNKRWETPWELYYWDGVTMGADGDPELVGAVRSNFSDPRLTQSSSTVLNTNLTGMLKYDVTFGDHTLNVLAGVTKEEFTGEGFNAYRRNYISPAVDQLFAGGSLQQNTGGSAYERARLGYYGRVGYNYKEKYLAEFIWRYDGSYIFPEADRFGFFPGVLAGWNVSNEDFFNVNAIDYLKVRGSFGQMGNDQVYFGNSLQEYAYLSTYGFGQYPINSEVVTTLVETRLANESFTWERANNLNIGLDATILGALDFTVEYFKNRRDQILIQESGSTPASSGISALLPPVNAGKVDNRGFEFNVMYSKSSGDLTFSTGVNGGYAKNKVVFMDEIPGAPEYQWQEGKPIGAYLIYESDGVFESQEEIAANTLDYSGVTGQLLPGDMKFKDYDGNGVIDGDDRVRIEQNNEPTLNFGATFDLQYRNFDLSLLLQGATGAKIRIQTESGDIGNFLQAHYENRWSIDNPSSEHPRLASRGDTYYTGGNYGWNSYWMQDKDYLRVKNIEIGYNVPKNVVGNGNVFQSLRIYVNALNLITFDGDTVFDPEATASNGVFYPLSRVINTGLSVKF
ncbi:MAG: TonB-dependent receptor [Cyclobacteriaceae bacterium]